MSAIKIENLKYRGNTRRIEVFLCQQLKLKTSISHIMDM